MKNNKKVFQVRRLQVEDISQICAIAEALESPAFHWPKDKLLAQLAESIAKSFVAEALETSSRGESILGFVCFTDLGPAVELPVLATAPESQGKGIMKALLSEIIASHYADRELWLEVHENNQAARNLYRTLGFVESGNRTCYYRDGCAAILCNRFPT